jgi:hypothetical protein
VRTFSLSWKGWQGVAGKLGLDVGGELAGSYKAQHNIAPTDSHIIVTTEYERRRLGAGAWSIVGRGTIGRPASASTREPRP